MSHRRTSRTEPRMAQVGGAPGGPRCGRLADFGVMRLATLRRPRGGDRPPGVAGPARMDLRTKRLTKRLRPGDIAIIDHVDLDRVAAEALVSAKVCAVVNAAPSISGRYPNLGPEILLAAGVPLLDDAHGDLFGRIREGEIIRLYDDTLYAADG